MVEEKFTIFINSVKRYFHQANKTDVEVGTPYLSDKNVATAFDMTGIIGITGPYKGCVYFSAPKVLLKHTLAAMKENDYSDENLKDLVGEIANTISGNAREEFGHEFMISVPIVISGSPDDIHLPKDARSFVIPLIWKSYQALIVISLVEN